MRDFSTLRAAKAFVRSLERRGVYDSNIGVEEVRDSNLRKRKRYTVRWSGSPRRSNPTKAQRATARKKAATERRVAAALANYLKRQNPGMKATAAKVEKLKGGVLKITPIKAARRVR